MEENVVAITIKDVYTPYFWEEFEDDLADFLARYGVEGSIHDERTHNNTKIKEKDEK